MSPTERAEKLVEWIERDRKESDKVLMYVLELKQLLPDLIDAAERGGILHGTEWEDEDPYK